MEKKKTLLLLALVLVLLLGGAGMLYEKLGQSLSPDQLAAQVPVREETQETQETQKPAEPEKVPAPDFTVYDGEGKEVRLSDCLGKPVVLNFWASWCGPCQMEMPDFQEKFLELGEDVHFLMVNATDGSRETADTACAFIARQEYTFPVFYDTAYGAAIAYGVSSLPTTYFIDAEGNVIARAMGAIDGPTLQRGIDMIYQPPQ